MDFLAFLNQTKLKRISFLAQLSSKNLLMKHFSSLDLLHLMDKHAQIFSHLIHKNIESRVFRRSHFIYCLISFEMTLNYLVIVERYPFLNGVVIDSILAVKSSLYLTKKLAKHVESQEPTHNKVGSKPHLAPRGFLSRVRPLNSNPHRITQCWLFDYLFIYCSIS
jgi:hypothetical protein